MKTGWTYDRESEPEKPEEDPEPAYLTDFLARGVAEARQLDEFNQLCTRIINAGLVVDPQDLSPTTRRVAYLAQVVKCSFVPGPAPAYQPIGFPMGNRP